MAVKGHRARSWIAGAVAAMLGGSLLTFAGSAAPAAADTIRRDGQTPGTAAASCWEIKQLLPRSRSGTYWLQTPKLVAPGQFYCDMYTDGGGWVLVGRGRDGWRQEYSGLGTPAEVRSPVSGVSAFAPKQLPARTIDGLLNGGRVSSLRDGIRLRRALKADGSSWQESRVRLTSMKGWVWTFAAPHPVTSWRFGKVLGTAGTIHKLGVGGGTARIYAEAHEDQAWKLGWSYGKDVVGRTSSRAYVYSATRGAGYALPFTQVWLRPKLRSGSLGYAAIPDSGVGRSQLPVQHSSFAMPRKWAVTGLADGVEGEMHAEVTAFAQVGRRVYVGGNFKYVQRDQAGTGKAYRPYLAAFDVNTGEWDSGFRPVLNGRVRALKALPGGQLAVGGYFTAANGARAGGIVALDPATGRTDGSWRASTANRATGGVTAVRSFDVQGGYLYVGGSFTHISGGSATSPIASRSLARLRLSDGSPDGSWRLNLNGTVVSVDASAAGDRVYAAGYFTKAGTRAVPNAAVISSRAGAAVRSWQFVSSNADEPGFQFAIREIGQRFYVGGSQHSLFGYDRTTLSRASGVIATRGGDFQTMTEWKGLLYAGCHCDDWAFSHAFTFIKKTYRPGPGWTRADKISFIGAWNASTGSMLPDFNPVLKGRMGYGAWASFVDSTGNLWVGGDFRRTVTRTGPTWIGGFARFPVRDTLAPTAPASLTHEPFANGSMTLSWTPSSDTSRVRYEVLREDRVIATTSSTRVSVPAPTSSTRYFVRAVDSEGNRSASTPVLRVVLSAPATPVVTATPTTPTSITVAWNAVPNVSTYLVYRGDVLVSQQATPSFADSGLAPGTTYTYTVIAQGLNGLKSAPGRATATTLPAPVLTAPVVSASPVASPPSVTLSWGAVTGATGYRISRDGTVLQEGGGLQYVDTGVTAGTTYNYTVVALGSGAVSPPGTISVTVPTAAPALSAEPGASSSAGQP